MEAQTYILPASAAAEQLRGEGWTMSVRTAPYGRALAGEVLDVQFSAGSVIPYHTRQYGFVSILVLSGSAEVTLYGNRCTAGPGALIQTEPHMPCGFRFPVDTTLRILANGLDLARICREREQLRTQNAALLDALYLAEGIRILPDPDGASCQTLPEIAQLGAGQEVFPLQSVVCRLLAGRWQLGCKAEVWEFDLEAGKTLSDPGASPELAQFVVVDGSVELTVNGCTQTAAAGDILRIAPYQGYTITASAGGAALVAGWYVPTLLRYLEQWEVARNAQAGEDRRLTLAAENGEPLQGLV